jgi:transposase
MSKQKTLTPKRQYHTKEFKLSAVKMVLEEHIEANEVAKRLGLNTNDLKRWVKSEEKKKVTKDQEAMKDLLLANRKLEEENKRLKMEREILKKAMAYFMPGQN